MPQKISNKRRYNQQRQRIEGGIRIAELGGDRGCDAHKVSISSRTGRQTSALAGLPMRSPSAPSSISAHSRKPILP